MPKTLLFSVLLPFIYYYILYYKLILQSLSFFPEQNDDTNVHELKFLCYAQLSSIGQQQLFKNPLEFRTDRLQHLLGTDQTGSSYLRPVI